VPPRDHSIIEATIINPYRSANMGAEVSGIIDKLNFEEGQLIKKGEVVVEISKKRYQLLVEKAEEAVRSLQTSLKVAQRDLELKEDLLANDATTRQEVLKAEADIEIARARLAEAKKDLKLARLNLEFCQICAPFTGYMAVRYKQQYEPVERLEKIFAIVDSAKVYAVANVPEDLVRKLKISDAAVFKSADGKIFSGEIAKIGKLIDPKSGSKRVYVLIDNSAGGLEVGMTGSLELSKQGRESR
jgi:RND family efflux transporter MFP subunit